jgi:hypothetical protein
MYQELRGGPDLEFGRIVRSRDTAEPEMAVDV